MQEVIELKPCPFCGGEAKIYNNNDACHVRCTVCNATSATWQHGIMELIVVANIY